jgi:hypothetical protein
MRHTRATFKTDPLNLLAYTADPSRAVFGRRSGSQCLFDRRASSTIPTCTVKQHLIKAGFQLDRTQSVNKTRLFTFADDGAGQSDR